MVIMQFKKDQGASRSFMKVHKGSIRFKKVQEGSRRLDIFAFGNPPTQKAG